MKYFAALIMGIFLLSLLMGCESTSPSTTASQISSTTQATVSKVYVDPKGFFSITPPPGWSLLEYPDDQRGKVAFLAGESNVDLRVLAKPVDTANYQWLIRELQDIETELDVPMNIEPILFNGLPAVKRVATMTAQGITLKLLWIDILIDGISHNIQYGAPPAAFDDYYNTVWQSILTYEPLKPVFSSREEELQYKLSNLITFVAESLDLQAFHAAEEGIKAGLLLDEENEDLLYLQSELEMYIEAGEYTPTK
jgi:hypothetical protein